MRESVLACFPFFFSVDFFRAESHDRIFSKFRVLKLRSEIVHASIYLCNQVSGENMRFWVICLCLLVFSCDPQSDNDQKAGISGFIILSPEKSGIDFGNNLTHTEELNTYTYRNFYNGAGVALGDINNDGLLDVYISGNQVDNKLYLNKGNFQFQDITEKAGVAAANSWSTGVSMADVNGDGYIDLYVCKSGPPQLPESNITNSRHNQLFINNGDLTFIDKAREYRVADEGLSTHAAFFDYDKDGDLDMYLLNNSTRPIGAYDLKLGRREERDPEGANKLYRNDGEYFTDVSEAAGIYGSAIGYGLGVTIGDVNKDGWQDIFISNDFFERDYLYINQKNGSFEESLEESMSEISMGSMGADMGDINNDGLPEVYVTEMLPPTLERIKTKTLFESWDKYQTNLKNGYHHQFTRNVLQLNNGLNAEGQLTFSEIARYTGLEATDWSWGALIFDYNNDTHKDIFVANGIYKDLTDHDYVNYYANNDLFIAKYKADSTVLTNLINKIPSTPVQNFLFQNAGDLNFKNVADAAGLKHKGFSNGAVYGDLDNDGDLDLIINNINDVVSVYKNQSSKGNYIQFQLEGIRKNTAAIGTQITVYCDGKMYYQEQSPVKGYLSSVDPRVHFGLGKHQQIDSVIIRWPDDQFSKIIAPELNQLLILKEKDQVKQKRIDEKLEETLFQEIDEKSILEYLHQESNFIDFNRNRLAFEMISAEGPLTSIADINGDHKPDIFVGGAKDSPARLFVSTDGNEYKSTNEKLFATDDRSEDAGSVFFDADGDGDLDLFVCSGGIEFQKSSTWNIDRLYLNDGTGNFTRKSSSVLSAIRGSSSFVKVIDYDNDNDYDLLIGTRSIAYQYGVPGNIYLLQNDGKGNFKNVPYTESVDFKQAGMLKDAEVADIDNDGDEDLIVAGEWLPLTIFINDQGKFIREEISNSSGLWNTVVCADFNGDGLTDIFAGNQGLNTRFEASTDKPMSLYVNDFDNNGSVEQIITQFEGDSAYPVSMLQDLVKQMPHLRKKIRDYDNYKNKTIAQLFEPAILERSIVPQVENLETSLYLNKGGLDFEKAILPKEMQFSQVHAVAVEDLNGDGHKDLVLGGNQLRARPEWGINNASRGQVFIGDGEGEFTYLPESHSGLSIPGEVRDIDILDIDGNKYVFFWRNNLSVKKYKVK